MDPPTIQILLYALKDYYASEATYSVDNELIGWKVSIHGRIDSRYEESTKWKRSNEVLDDAVEYGVSSGESASSASEHVVSIDGQCTCLFRNSWGIACRHIIHVSTVTQHKDANGQLAVIGGSFSPYWLQNQTVSEPNVPIVTSKEPAMPLVRTVVEAEPRSDRYQKCSMLQTLFFQHIKQHPSLLDEATILLRKACESIGAPTQCDVLNPAKPANKPGRKRQSRFPSQHDHKKEKVCKS